MDAEKIARKTLEILEKGTHRSPNGKRIDLSDSQHRCLKNTQCYDPEELTYIHNSLTKQTDYSGGQTDFEVNNETTLQGSRRVALQNSHHHIGVLNFASARNPGGGGFKNGAQAQEESLARSSALYPSLRQCSSYYEYHRSHQSTLLYSDRMIWSPQCPVFRTDDGTLLDQPYTVSFITSPAPNAGAVRQNEPENIPKIEPTLRERSAKILALAAHHNCDALVLGAWGCGVFQNDPDTVAQTFWNHLGPEGLFYHYFQKVTFSVLDNTSSKRIIAPFHNYFDK